MLYMSFPKTSSTPTQTDSFSRSSKLHDCNVVLPITGPVQYKKMGVYSHKKALNNRIPTQDAHQFFMLYLKGTCNHSQTLTGAPQYSH